MPTNNIYENEPKYTDANIEYNGAPQPDEDPADYVRVKPIKAVKLG